MGHEEPFEGDPRMAGKGRKLGLLRMIPGAPVKERGAWFID